MSEHDVADQLRVQHVAITRLRAHPRNIRTRLTHLDRLAASIRKHGIQVPLVAHRKFRRDSTDQDLEIIYGHRRLAAAYRVGLKTVPCQVRPFMTDQDILLLMLAERQRVDPDAAGIAKAVVALRFEFGMSDAEIAEQLGTTTAQVWAWSRGQGDLPDSPRLTPNTPAPAALPPRPTLQHPVNDVPARQHRPAPQPKPKPATLGSRRAPTISAGRLYTLVRDHDAGTLTADLVVTRVRGLLGGWQPPDA